jgi:hypothetical protein
LPENGDSILITWKLGFHIYVCCGEYYGDGFHGLDEEWLTLRGRQRKAIAWMPLPEPYKAESEDKK